MPAAVSRSDRNNPVTRTLPLSGEEFVKRHLHHVQPAKLRAVRYYGYHHPTASRAAAVAARQTAKNEQHWKPRTKEPLAKPLPSAVCMFLPAHLFAFNASRSQAWRRLAPEWKAKTWAGRNILH
ncbi:MAG: transposase, partial [Prosthecobacter sp.]|uniref:transposase n=1 Tax=Prosthecobacter sp. TaxID=1965333 RepID=UPI0038FE3F55